MTNQVIHGDCLKVPLPSNYFDTLITDPPYGLSFMGKDWDAGVPGVRFWKKFLDACKPGAFAFVFGGTRTHHRLVCAIEDAGWEIRDCMMWLYGSGFPKSLDISKAIDKTKGAEREVTGIRHTRTANEKYGGGKGTNLQTLETLSSTDLAKTWDGYGTALKPAWEPIIVAMKPLDGTFAHNAEKWGVGGLWIDGGRIQHGETIHTPQSNPIKREGVVGTDLGISKSTVEKFQESQRASIERTNTLGRWPANVILDEEAGAMVDQQSGVSKSNANPRRGQGFHNCLGREDRPRLDGDIAKGHTDSGGASRFFKKIDINPRSCFFCGYVEEHGNLDIGPGIWACDECLLDGAVLDLPIRFRYCPKASKREREAGLDALPEKLYARSGGAQGQVARGEDEYLEDSIGLNRISKVKNNHPTVKPLALMEYLCKLSRPPQGGIVLDPFAGSGTTALARVNTDRQYVVIEKEREYCEIIAARLGGVEIETALPVSKHHSTDIQEPIKVQGYPSAPHENPSPNAEPGKASVVPPQQPLCSFCGGLLREAGTNWICLKCKKIYRHLI